MNAAATAVSARAEIGSGHHEGPGSSVAIGTLLNPANDSVTRLSSLFHNRFVCHRLWSRGVSATRGQGKMVGRRAETPA